MYTQGQYYMHMHMYKLYSTSTCTHTASNTCTVGSVHFPVTQTHPAVSWRWWTPASEELGRTALDAEGSWWLTQYRWWSGNQTSTGTERHVLCDVVCVCVYVYECVCECVMCSMCECSVTCECVICTCISPRVHGERERERERERETERQRERVHRVNSLHCDNIPFLTSYKIS